MSHELQPLLDHTEGDASDVKRKSSRLSNITNLKKFQKLFDFNESNGFGGSASLKQVSSANAEAVFHKYLACPSTSFDIFESFPEIGKLFIRYNTPLCSSAPCERLFSIAKRILTVIRSRLLQHKNFEFQLLLKANLFPSSR